MIEIQTKRGLKNIKLYRWSCSLCNKKGLWFSDPTLALDSGAKHVKVSHE